MKKITFYNLFLVFAVILFIGTKNIHSSILLIFASILELVDIIPKLIKVIKELRDYGE